MTQSSSRYNNASNYLGCSIETANASPLRQIRKARLEQLKSQGGGGAASQGGGGQDQAAQRQYV